MKITKELEQNLEILDKNIQDFEKVIAALVKMQSAEPKKLKLALSFLKKYM